MTIANDKPHQPRRESHMTKLPIFTQPIVYHSSTIDRITWNADAIVQPLCLKLRWDLPLGPRRRGALAQSEQAQAILGKQPSSSTDSTSELEKDVGPTRVGDRYGLPSPPEPTTCTVLTFAAHQSCVVV